MRDRDIIRLSAEAAKIEVRGGDSSQLLADGLHRLLDADAGVGVGRWALASPHTGHIATAGVPQFTAKEWADLVKWAPNHPTFLKISTSTTPYLLSAEVPLKTFWHTEVWWHLHGVRDGKYPAGMGLGVHDGQVGLIGIHRKSRDFSADEVGYLNLLQEPLQSALRFRAALDGASRRLSAVEPVIEVARDDSDRGLTARERDVLALVATGRTNTMIGNILGITERTVRKHLTNAFSKLEISNRTSAAVWYRNAMASSGPSGR